MDPTTLENIRRAKYRYLRCVDLKRWDELGDTLTEDAVADYGTRALGEPLHLTGRDEIVSTLRGHLAGNIITIHSVTQPEIDVRGDDATGSWLLQDTVIATEYRVAIHGSAYYHDTYRRESDDVWRIASTGYERIHETTMSLDDLPSLRFTVDPSSVNDTSGTNPHR